MQLNNQIQREIEARRKLQKQIQSISPQSSPASLSQSSVVGDLASAVGDLSLASASALGNLASYGVTNLVVKPLKGAADIIKSSFTPSTASAPSTPFVSSSDVFPESQSVRSTDVFPGSQLVTPNQTGIWSSTHPFFYMSGSPYPMDLASQSAAIGSAQQAAQLMSGPNVQSSSPPSSRLSSSLTLQPASGFNPSTIPSSSLTFPQESTTLPYSSLVYPSQTLSGQP